jgi:hypothetical protein
MTNVHFDPPVRIRFGNPGQVRNVTSIREAAECLLSDKWPNQDGPICEIAAKALVSAHQGKVTAAEARQAFGDAALESRVLVTGDQKH